MIAVQVAAMIDTAGFWCRECTGMERHHPVSVNWVGLFDAVNMTEKDHGFPRSKPSNVAHLDHAVKTLVNQRFLPTWHFEGENEKKIYNNDGTVTTHTQVGGSLMLGVNNAYGWMRAQGIAAGVGF